MYTYAEMKVVRELIKGLSDSEIAANIGMATKTVRFHLLRIYKKSNTKSRSDFISSYYRALLKAKEHHFAHNEIQSKTLEFLFKNLRSNNDVLPKGVAS